MSFTLHKIIDYATKQILFNENVLFLYKLVHNKA